MAVQQPTSAICALRRPSRRQARVAEATLFLPTAAVLRDENAATPGMVWRQAQIKAGWENPPCRFLRQLCFRTTPLVQERRPALFVSLRFGPGYF
jgi:hypothetical protein